MMFFRPREPSKTDKITICAEGDNQGLSFKVDKADIQSFCSAVGLLWNDRPHSSKASFILARCVRAESDPKLVLSDECRKFIGNLKALAENNPFGYIHIG